eukprot:1005091-Rhodomonas_salina.3
MGRTARTASPATLVSTARGAEETRREGASRARWGRSRTSLVRLLRTHCLAGRRLSRVWVCAFRVLERHVHSVPEGELEPERRPGVGVLLH